MKLEQLVDEDARLKQPGKFKTLRTTQIKGKPENQLEKLKVNDLGPMNRTRVYPGN